MVPVAIALIGTHLRPATVAFMGWFGPRGLASVVFTLLALEEIEHGGDGAMLLQTVTWTILLSVLLHGISASPLAARYGASIAKAGDIPEKAPAGEPADPASRPCRTPQPPTATNTRNDTNECWSIRHMTAVLDARTPSDHPLRMMTVEPAGPTFEASLRPASRSPHGGSS